MITDGERRELRDLRAQLASRVDAELRAQAARKAALPPRVHRRSDGSELSASQMSQVSASEVHPSATVPSKLLDSKTVPDQLISERGGELVRGNLPEAMATSSVESSVVSTEQSSAAPGTSVPELGRENVSEGLSTSSVESPIVPTEQTSAAAGGTPPPGGPGSLFAGCLQKLSDLIAGHELGTESNKIDVDWFVNVVASVAGSEVEGREVTVGIVFGPESEAGGIVGPGPRLPLELPLALADSRHAVRVIRDSIGAEANGEPGGSLALFARTTGRQRQVFYGLVQPSLGNLPASNADEVMRVITRDSRYLGALVRPATTIRLYDNGEFVAQVIKLRDGLGWSIRRVAELATTFSVLAGELAGESFAFALARQVVVTLLDLSEQRTGAAIYVPTGNESLEDEQGREAAGIARAYVHAEKKPVSLQPNRLRWRCEEDGAVVLTRKGELLASRVYFKSGGGRRRTAEEVCKTGRWVAGIVSQDGPMFMAGPSWIEIDQTRYR